MLRRGDIVAVTTNLVAPTFKKAPALGVVLRASRNANSQWADVRWWHRSTGVVWVRRERYTGVLSVLGNQFLAGGYWPLRLDWNPVRDNWRLPENG